MKAARPGRFAEIEQSSKLRVQDGDDMFVVAVLEHILREHPTDAKKESYIELREALRPWGIELSGEDMAGWVHQLRSQTPRPSQLRDGAARASHTSFAQAAQARQEQSATNWESAAKLGVSELVKRIAGDGDGAPAKSWMDLGDPAASKAGEITTPPASDSAASDSATSDGVATERKAHLDPDELFAPSDVSLAATDTDATDTDATDTDETETEAASAAPVIAEPNGSDDVEDDIFAVSDDDFIQEQSDDFGALSSDEDDPFADVFDDVFASGEPEPEDAPPSALSDSDAGSTDTEEVDATDRSAGLDEAAPASVEPEQALSERDTHTKSEAADGASWIDVFPTAPAPLKPREPEQTSAQETPVAHETPAREQTRAVAASTNKDTITPAVVVPDEQDKPRRKVAPSAPVRVELFPHTTPQRPSGTRKRKPKKSALPPEAFSTDGVVQSGLSEKTRSQLLAMCLTPRPVFSGDLADLVGDVSIVEEWQEETYANGKMRFIDAKSRHRQLGSLAIPHGDTRKLAGELEKSWWGASMDRYRGAKLYELGVVGRKLGTSIRSWHVDPVHPVVSLRVSDERGLQGVIVVCDDELEDGGMGRRGVVSEIEAMMREPLEIMYVLATGDKTLDPLVSAVEEEARRRGWKSSCSVVCARSWEWSDGSGPLIAVL
jgi:hypothetical protein